MNDFDVDEFLGGYTPPSLSVSITNRADLQDRWGELAERYTQLRDSAGESEALNDRTLDDVIDELERVSAELEASKRKFTFAAISSFDYKQLVADHPSEPNQAQGSVVNEDTFNPAVVARCCTEPKLTYAQAEAMMRSLSDAQWSKLVNTALAVNVGDISIPKFDLRSLRANAMRRSSDIRLSEESLAQSSSGE